MKETKTKRPVSSSALARLIIWLAVFCIFAGLFAAGMTDTNLRIDWLGIPLFQSGDLHYNDSEYSVGNGTVAASVTDLSVEWVAGSVTVVPSEGDDIVITEDYGGDDERLRLRWRVKDGELSVKYCAPVLLRRRKEAVAKDLKLEIPAVLLEAMDTVTINSVSCDVSYTGNADDLELDAVDGKLTVSGDIGELNVESVNGALIFRGGVRRADVECLKADVTMYLDMAANLSFEQMSGDVTLYLSEEITGFSVEHDSLSGRVETVGFENVTRHTDAVYWGDKSLRIGADGMETQLKIEKLTEN